MNRKASAPVLLLVILIIIALSLAGGGFYLFQKERSKNLELQDKVEEITTKQRITENKLDEAKKLSSDLQFKLQEANTQVTNLSTDLEKEKSARQEALTQIDTLKTDLERQKDLRDDIESKFNEAKNESTKIQNQLRDIESQKAELETKVKDLEAQSQGVELGKIVVSPETGVASAAQTQEKGKQAKKLTKKEKAAAKKEEAKKAEAKKEEAKTETAGYVAGLEGKVLVVNKDYNFVVINLGGKDGVAVGDTFSIYHNDKFVTDVKVEKVHDSMAAAGLITPDTKYSVSEGDKVVQKIS